MNSEPAPPGKLFLAIDGRPQGPHTAAAVMKLWQEGTIRDDTLICPDGGTAWVKLKEFEPALHAELPPVPPAGYGTMAARTSGVAGPTTTAPAAQVVVAAKSGNGTKGLRIGALAAALIFFFLPWVEMRCQGQRVMYQTGIHTILDSGKMDSELEKMGGIHESAGRTLKEGDKMDAGHSILAGAALLAVIIALAVSPGRTGKHTSGLLAAVALGCLGLQAVLGFPTETKLKKEINEGWSLGMKNMEGVGDPGGVMPMMDKMNPFVTKYAPWFYAELGALGLAAFLGLRRDS